MKRKKLLTPMLTLLLLVGVFSIALVAKASSDTIDEKDFPGEKGTIMVTATIYQDKSDTDPDRDFYAVRIHVHGSHDFSSLEVKIYSPQGICNHWEPTEGLNSGGSITFSYTGISFSLNIPIEDVAFYGEYTNETKWGIFIFPGKMDSEVAAGFWTEQGKGFSWDIYVKADSDAASWIVGVPHTPSTPEGDTTALWGETVRFSTSTTDPENDNIQYQFDWGDGTYDLTDWRPSGANAEASHSWVLLGTYNVRVRAQDPDGSWTRWSSSTSIHVDPIEPSIKVGVIGPMYWIQGIAMYEGACLARDMINVNGGINGHKVVLYDASTHPDSGTMPDAGTGAVAMLQLMSDGVDFVLGGFTTGEVLGARELAMDYQRIFTITGASADELIDHPDINTFPDTVRADYDRYKYMFRTSPFNSTTQFKSTAEFCKYMMAAKLMRIYALPPPSSKPLKIAVVSEDSTWADVIHSHLSSEAFWNVEMGMDAYGGVDVVYQNRVDPVHTTWVTGVVTAIDQSGARLLIEAISGPTGRAFVNYWGTVEVDAALVGIDIAAQEIPLHWYATGGGCETESILVTAGGADHPDSGNPINTEGPVKTQDFYRDYYNRFGHAPIYTSYGSFDTLMGIKETIERWIVQVGHDWPPRNQHEYDLLIPIHEMTDRHGLSGWFKFTGANPLPGQTYPPSFAAINPTGKGTLHDIYCSELGSTWSGGYTRPFVASWQAERLEIVFPTDRPYSKIWVIPSWMYPYPTDINQDGQRTITDISIVSYAVGTVPGHARWQFAADVNKDRLIDGNDLTPVANDYGKPIPLPLP